MSDPIVEIAKGKLRGKVRKTSKNVEYYSFKGIPYAKPPVDNLRFSVPFPPEPWEGIKDATKDCNAAPQYDIHSDNYIGKEDCLFLNVFTPKLSNEDSTLLPVMVYIHGGGFVFGHGTDDCNNGPDYLIEKGVVVVTINYRLGILGFLSLDCKEAPGNMGLRDQVQALKWVQPNIEQFKGNPNNVTIFGLSAGGASVEFLLLSPMARGLFHKAIAQCGSSLCHWAQYSKMKQLVYKIPELDGKSISNDQELLQYLKSLDTKELIVLSMKALALDEFRGGVHFGFVPVIEKPGDWEPFLNKNTYDLLQKGEFTKVPFMGGFACREGLLMLSMGGQILEKVVTEKKFVQALPFELDAAQEMQMEARLKEIYLGAENVYKDSDAFGIDYFTDVLILGGVHVATSLISKHNKHPVYFYEFSYDGNFNHVKKMLSIDREGACHGDELGYLMKIVILNDAPTPSDVVVRERMVTMWTNFATYGNPTPKINNFLPLNWEPFNKDKMSCLIINKKLSMKHEVYTERTELFEELYEKYSCSNLS